MNTAAESIPKRAAVEVGVIVTVLLTLLTMAFQAGIAWNRITALEVRTTDLQANQSKIKDTQAALQTTTSVRLEHIETLLQTMSNQLQVKQ